MLFLTAAPKGDPAALVMVLCLLVFVAVLAVRKHIAKKAAAQAAEEAATVEVAAPAPAPVVQPVAPGSAGHIKLHSVEPKTAAMIMAIVADKMGKPLNELRFISIREVENK